MGTRMDGLIDGLDARRWQRRRYREPTRHRTARCHRARLRGLNIRACRRKRRRAIGLCPAPTSPSRPFGSYPSRLRACGAARFACLRGKAQWAIPAAHGLAPLMESRTGSAGSAGAVPRRNGQGTADTPWFAAAGCVNACRPRRWRVSPITSRRTVYEHGTRPHYGASIPHFKHSAARCGEAFSPWSVGGGSCPCQRRASAAFMQGCRVGPVSFRSGSAQGVLVLL